jgi:glycosyltransferase involved in cell wall biosynthesis
MKVLQVVLDLGPHSTGVLVTVMRFNEALRALGHSVQILSFDRQDYTAEESRESRIVSVPALIPVLRRYALSPQAALGEYDSPVKSSDAVFIHALYGHHFTWAARRAMRWQKLSFVIPHGALTDFCLSRRTLIKKAWLASVHRFTEQHATMIFSSQYEREQALHYVRPARSTVMYWPATELCGTPHDGPRKPPQRPTLLLVGRLHPMKRTIETVRSFRRARLDGWRLCLAGLPSPEVTVDDLRQASGNDWEESVCYLGNLNRSDLSNWYRIANAVVLFSKGDNFSHAVAEALLAGCPAYVSEDVGMGELIRKYECGKVFSIRAEADLDDALASTVSDIATNGRTRSHDITAAARRELSFSTFTEKVGQVLGGAAFQLVGAGGTHI